jgi:membrane fusion protein (multidrug efflux system)
VIAVLADDTNAVEVGQALVRLDPADAKVALQQSEAALAQAVRQVRSVYANTNALSAQVAQRQADLARIPAEDRGARAAAEAALTAAREQLASQQTLTDGTPLEDHPGVQSAAARVREAWLATQRLVLPAPVAGHVARRTVQLGQRVAAGTPLMTIVPLDQLWVDANFKEVQLRKLRIGQPVVLSADLYGRQVNYRGTVAGLGAGTGAAFALLPAQNATGNWIKVVQRVPVRIALDPQDLAAHPLRVGLSMHVEVDVSRQDGQRLEPRATGLAGGAAQAMAVDIAGADALVRKVIAANLGRGVSTGVAPAVPAATPAARSASAASTASAATAVSAASAAR